MITQLFYHKIFKFKTVYERFSEKGEQDFQKNRRIQVNFHNFFQKNKSGLINRNRNDIILKKEDKGGSVYALFWKDKKWWNERKGSFYPCADGGCGKYGGYDCGDMRKISFGAV